MLGTKILEETTLKYNGHIRVVRTLGLGTYIQVEGLTQSGGVVEDIWRDTLKKLQNSKHPKLQTCLILGLGGGSAAKWVRNLWPKAKITGVEIDPVMVELGTKHLGLGNNNVVIIIADAYEYLSKIKNNFELILVDVYQGDEVPKKFESLKFLNNLKNHISEKGIVVFNRLYFGERRPEAMKFGKKLEKLFSKVDYFHPEANLMLICRT